MKIKNKDGKSWISQWSQGAPLYAIHVVNAGVEEASLKGTNLVIRVSAKPRGGEE